MADRQGVFGYEGGGAAFVVVAVVEMGATRRVHCPHFHNRSGFLRFIGHPTSARAADTPSKFTETKLHNQSNSQMPILIHLWILETWQSIALWRLLALMNNQKSQNLLAKES